MATRTEMVEWLKANHPEMCKYQKIDILIIDTVHRLYIEYHGGTDTWDTLTRSEKDAVYNTLIAIELFYLDNLHDDAPVFNVEEMKNNWIFAEKDGKRLGISGGGVLSINSHPFTKNGNMMCDIETIMQGLSENF